MFALVDCNNFFVACEQVFNPKLKGRPVVVLSSNDGCIISRSKEAKALGIGMGAPAFQYRDCFLLHSVVSLSSNFALYSDMSERLVLTLEELGFPLDVYSIDEVFIELPEGLDERWAQKVRAQVLQWTGIPVSIGLGATKTLAKAASELAKQEQDGVKRIVDPKIELQTFPIEEIWGIGHKTAASLRSHSIFTTAQLMEVSEIWIQQKFSVTMLRTILELKGTSCIPFEEAPAPKKGITTSRTFGSYLTTFEEVSEAIASFVVLAAEKLRSQESSLGSLTIFIEPKEGFSYSALVRMPIPTSYTPEILSYAKKGLKEIYLSDKQYRRGGVMFHELISSSNSQLDLFTTPLKNPVMPIVDQINRKKGRNTIFFGAQGVSQKWKPLSNHCSPKYTTKWSDVLKIKT